MKAVLNARSLSVFALALFAFTASADSFALYGATSSGHGELYVLNPATGGASTDVGPINAGATNYSITGLAFDPTTNTLYGSTGAVSGASLLTIDPNTADATVVGNFNAGAGNTMTDLAFDSSGNLYGISATGGANLYSIDKTTGAATIVGVSGVSFTEGGGLAVSSGGAFYGTPVPGDYGTYDPNTGVYVNITTPDTPVGGSYGALTFAGSILFGDNLAPGPGGGRVTHLVTIDPTTGAVTDIGPSITKMDAIAAIVPEPGPLTLFAAAGMICLSRKRNRRIQN